MQIIKRIIVFILTFLTSFSGLTFSLRQTATDFPKAAAEAHIRNMHPDCADFFHIVGTMLIAAAGFTVQTKAMLSGAFVTAQGRGLYLAVHPVLAGIEREAWFPGSNLH